MSVAERIKKKWDGKKIKILLPLCRVSQVSARSDSRADDQT